MKKKMLITALVSTAAVVGGVAPTVITSTSVQASSVDIKDPQNPIDPTNPVDPVNPDPVDPNPVNPDPVNPDPVNPNPVNPDPVNPDPVNPDPVDPDPVNPDPVDPNPVNPDPVDPDPVNPDPPVEPTLVSLYPTSLTDSFTYDIKYSGTTDDAGLDSYLRSILKSDNPINIADYLENKDQYKNVNLIYNGNSANYANKTFNIVAVPVENSQWETNNWDPYRIIKVTIKNFSTTFSLDSVAPTKAKIAETMDFRIGILKDSDLNSMISSYMSYNGLTFSANDNSNTTFQNVNIKYVQNSASIANKTFKVNLTPKSGHAWKDNGSTAARTITVDIPKINWAGNTVFVQPGWTANEIINNDFRYDFWYQTGKAWTITQDKWIHVFDYVHWNAKTLKIIREGFEKYIKKQIFNTAIKDYQKVFAVDPVGTYENAAWDDATLSENWYFTHFFFRANVKPKAGHAWIDGGTYAKEVQFNLWSCNLKYAPVNWGNTSSLDQLPNQVAPNYYSVDNLPKRWISLYGFDKNFNGSEETKKKTLASNAFELSAAYQPWYKVETSNLRPATNSSKLAQPWMFDIKFTSVTNPSQTRITTGYIFSLWGK